MGDREMGTIERAVYVAWKLAEGNIYSTAQVAALLDTSWEAAYYLMNTASRILPIDQDDEKRWRVCARSKSILD